MVRDGREEKSTGRTVTEGGKVWVLLLRVRTVTVKPAARSLWRIAGPRFPVALRELDQLSAGLGMEGCRFTPAKATLVIGFILGFLCEIS